MHLCRMSPVVNQCKKIVIFLINMRVKLLIYIVRELGYGALHSTDFFRTIDQLFIFKI
jgi:hypothetical protein